MAKIPYLTKKNNIYYFRSAVPLRLISKIGKRETIFSLKTKCAFEARQKNVIVMAKINQAYQKIAKMPRIKPEEANAIIKKYFQEAMTALEKQFDAIDGYSEFLSTVSQNNESNVTHADRLDFLYPDEVFDNKGEFVLGLHDNITPDYERIFEYVTTNNDLDVMKGTYSAQVIENGIKRAVKELLNLQSQYASGETEIHIQDTLFKTLASVQNGSTNSVTPAISPYTLEDLFHKYRTEKKRSGETDNSIEQKYSRYSHQSYC